MMRQRLLTVAGALLLVAATSCGETKAPEGPKPPAAGNPKAPTPSNANAPENKDAKATADCYTFDKPSGDTLANGNEKKGHSITVSPVSPCKNWKAFADTPAPSLTNFKTYDKNAAGTFKECAACTGPGKVVFDIDANNTGAARVLNIRFSGLDQPDEIIYDLKQPKK